MLEAPPNLLPDQRQEFAESIVRAAHFYQTNKGLPEDLRATLTESDNPVDIALLDDEGGPLILSRDNQGKLKFSCWEFPTIFRGEVILEEKGLRVDNLTGMIAFESKFIDLPPLPQETQQDCTKRFLIGFLNYTYPPLAGNL